MKFKFFFLTLFLLPFIIISFFNHPAIDDYWSANTIIKNGRVGAIIYFYNHVSGRYFSHLLMSFTNSLPYNDVWIFKAAPVLFLLLLFYSICRFFLTINESADKRDIALAALCAVALHVINMRSLFEGLYWLSSTMVYELCIVILLLAISSLIKGVRTNKRGSIVASIILSFLLPGTYEAIAPVYTIFLILYFLLKRTDKKAQVIIALNIAGTVAGIILVLLSKGNFIRIRNDSIHYDQSVVFAAYQTISTAGYYFFIFALNPVNILAVLLLLPYLMKSSTRVKNMLSALKPLNNIFLLPILCIACLCCLYFPLYYFEADIPFPRITIVFFILSVIFFLILVTHLITVLKSFKQKIYLLISWQVYKKYVWPLFITSLFLTPNFLSVMKDLTTGKAYNYNKEAFAHDQLIRSCTNDTCYVPRFNNWPSSIQSTLNENPSTERFIHMDKYYGKTLILK